ncbi:MAG: hypothetical protein ACLUKN_11425 [Bacilli bacterium]
MQVDKKDADIPSDSGLYHTALNGFLLIYDGELKSVVQQKYVIAEFAAIMRDAVRAFCAPEIKLPGYFD